MQRRTRYALGSLVLIAIAIAIIASRSDSGPPIATLDARRTDPLTTKETAGLCPWRNPDADRLRFFPDSTGAEDETLVLSRYRAEVTRILGHPPDGADNVLPLHWIVRDRRRLGAIITRAVRGESGVIEQVMAVDMQGSLIGIRLQRLREPDTVAHSLQSSAWLGAFRGRTAHSMWQLGRDIPEVPADARISAEAIADGARTTLTLLEVGTHH
jgi:hypothetical protein